MHMILVVTHFRLIVLLFLISPVLLFAADFQIINLKVDNVEKPLGLDEPQPNFSWEMQSLNKQKGGFQKAYQLIVTSDKGNVVWNTGKVKSDVSINIKYTGETLLPTTVYRWILYVWNQKGNKYKAQSSFETGLMNAKMVTNTDSGQEKTAWSGAKWIGGNAADMVLYSHYLPVFVINCSIQLDKISQSTKAGFIYGSNDERLLDRNKNLYQLENKKDNSYIKVELDISPLTSNGSAKLNVYRVGYAANDKINIPFKSFEISNSIINKTNQYNIHTINIQSNLGTTKIYIDGQTKENLIANFNLNPLGAGGDFVAFPVVGDIGFSVSKGQKAKFSDFQIKNFRSPSNIIFSEDIRDETKPSLFSKFKEVSSNNGTYSITGVDSDVLILANPSSNSMPILRTTFDTKSEKISKARLYVTARGIYDIYMNGKRIGDDYFNPGLTQYNKHIFIKLLM